MLLSIWLSYDLCPPSLNSSDLFMLRGIEAANPLRYSMNSVRSRTQQPAFGKYLKSFLWMQRVDYWQRANNLYADKTFSK